MHWRWKRCEGGVSKMEWIRAFWVGGLICAAGQVLLQRTQLTPARIVVIFVVAGAILGGIGWYEPLVQYAGAGATVPITGFGYSLAKGVMEEIDASGAMGILSGGLKATAAGIAAAVLFGFLGAVLFQPKIK